MSAARQTALRGAPDGARQGYRQGCFWWDLRREPFGRPHQPEDHQTPLAGGGYPTDNAVNASNGGQATGRKSSFGNHFHRARPQRIGTLSSGCGTLSSSVETVVLPFNNVPMRQASESRVQEGLNAYRFKASLYVEHPAIGPDEATKALGLEPASVRHDGQPRLRPDGSRLDGVVKGNHWAADLEIAAGQDIPAFLIDFFERLPAEAVIGCEWLRIPVAACPCFSEYSLMGAATLRSRQPASESWVTQVSRSDSTSTAGMGRQNHPMQWTRGQRPA